ncbi:hypothetical protein REC12_12795 [Desulfosporosinus sp. PR]|uniref:Uma2 family endonuclease n=1 Tax=Candidatus Desulfosporosinus nitrosoreducens TaxID=3401928 RepID=UPI0027EB3A22|nr:Uma2 family endonuclease [Desulfosporosinus sp. PR]MDQ7094468.1 hypothetical protein [Desulfosporosinus sp. PR]
MEKARNPKEFYTYKEYRQWPEDERWEIIDGIPFNLTLAPSPNHQRVLGELFSAFKLYLKGKHCEVFVAPFEKSVCNHQYYTASLILKEKTPAGVFFWTKLSIVIF